MPNRHYQDHVRQPMNTTNFSKLGKADHSTVPKARGHSWDRILAPILKEDRVKCDAWNDEIQTLLIFAGLFSAVVTAFVIQSYQDIVSILRSDLGLTGATQKSYNSSVRVNILWFLSLILSLTTVLVGIISMQWIREYTRYSDSSSAKRKLAIRNMRADGLEKWKVPEIIAGLPLLLQSAVILFFVGLVDFLLNVSVVVATPAIIVISMALLFIFMTIVLPACQCLWIANADIPTDQILQCPYKSPQAWTFIGTLSHPFIRWLIVTAVALTSSVAIAALFPIGLISAKVFGINLRPRRLNYLFFSRFFKNMQKNNLRNWDAFDGIFLKRRQQVASTRTGHVDLLGSSEGMFDYDASMSIAHLLNEHVYDQSLAHAAYDCFRSLPSSVISEDFLMPKDVSRPRTMGKRPLRISEILPPVMDDTKITLCQHEDTILFLENLLHPLETHSLPFLRSLQLETFIRTVDHIFTDPAYAAHHVDGTEKNEGVKILSDALKQEPLQGLLAPSVLNDIKAFREIPHDVTKEINVKLLDIMETVIRNAVSSQGRNVSVFCQRDDLMVDFTQLVYTATHATLLSAPSNGPQASSNLFRQKLTNITSVLAENVTADLPKGMWILASLGTLFAAQFRLEDIHTWHLKAPEFASAFTALVHALRAFEFAQQIFDKTFLIQQGHLIQQWELLASHIVPVVYSDESLFSSKRGSTCYEKEIDDRVLPKSLSP